MSEEDKNKEEVKVTDKRRVFQSDSEDDSAEAGEPAGPQAEAKDERVSPEEEEESGPEQEELIPEIDVYDTVRWFISMLTAQAWQHMGLVMNPRTKLVVKDLLQAKVAIDCVAALVQQLETKVDATEQRELRALLSNLRLNFVQQSTG